jgi:hypothetical protein
MATVFQAEMCAILAAAQTTVTSELFYKQQGISEIDIISDSLSSLQALTKQVTTSQLVKDTKDMINTLSEMFTVNLHWIKAHQGHAGNELADQTAKKATQNPTYLVEPIIPVSRSWIQKKIKYFLHKEWSIQWNRLPEARQTKLFFPTPHIKTSKNMLKYNRETYGELFRWITGHSFHRYHNSLTNPIDYPDPTCRACGIAREENGHLIMDCPVFATTRHKIFGHHILQPGFKWEPGTLLEMINVIKNTVPEEPPIDYTTNTQTR